MLGLVQFQVYNRLITPYIDMVIGDNQVYKVATYVGISALACCAAIYIGPTTSLAFIGKGLYGIAQLALASGINEIISMSSDSIKTTFESIVEDTMFEKYVDFIDPLIDISLVVLLRQTAGIAINHLNLGAADHVSYTIPQDKTTGIFSNMFASAYKIGSNILNFGKFTANNENNFVSLAFEQAACSQMFKGIFGLGGALFNMAQNNELSAYDIKKITSAQLGYKITKAQATDLYNKFQACTKYYDKTNDATKAKIDIIAGIYSRAYGDKQKELMKTSLSNEFVDKSLKMVDIQIRSSVIERLMNADNNLLIIQSFSERGLALKPEHKQMIKNATITKLNAEIDSLKQLCDISQDEVTTYKLFYYKSCYVETELGTLEMMQDVLEVNHDHLV